MRKEYLPFARRCLVHLRNMYPVRRQRNGTQRVLATSLAGHWCYLRRQARAMTKAGTNPCPVLGGVLGWFRCHASKMTTKPPNGRAQISKWPCVFWRGLGFVHAFVPNKPQARGMREKRQKMVLHEAAYVGEETLAVVPL